MPEEQHQPENENCKEHLAVKDRLNLILALITGIGLMMAYQTLSQTPDLKISMQKSFSDLEGRVKTVELNQAATDVQIASIKNQRNLDHAKTVRLY